MIAHVKRDYTLVCLDFLIFLILLILLTVLGAGLDAERTTVRTLVLSRTKGKHDTSNDIITLNDNRTSNITTYCPCGDRRFYCSDGISALSPALLTLPLFGSNSSCTIPSPLR